MGGARPRYYNHPFIAHSIPQHRFLFAIGIVGLIVAPVRINSHTDLEPHCWRQSTHHVFHMARYVLVSGQPD